MGEGSPGACEICKGSDLQAPWQKCVLDATANDVAIYKESYNKPCPPYDEGWRYVTGDTTEKWEGGFNDQGTCPINGYAEPICTSFVPDNELDCANRCFREYKNPLPSNHPPQYKAAYYEVAEYQKDKNTGKQNCYCRSNFANPTSNFYPKNNWNGYCYDPTKKKPDGYWISNSPSINPGLKPPPDMCINDRGGTYFCDQGQGTTDCTARSATGAPAACDVGYDTFNCTNDKGDQGTQCYAYSHKQSGPYFCSPKQPLTAQARRL